jgi:hypothetical protein
MNGPGDVVGEYLSGTFHGFLRAADGTFTTIDPKGSISTDLFSINDNGVITGDYVSDMSHGFVRAADGTITTFDPKGAAGTNPECINASGAVTGWYWDSRNQVHGFLRTP